MPLNPHITTVKVLSDHSIGFVHQQTLVNRIFQLIAIVSDYEQASLLKELPGVTIPYYMLGMTDELRDEFRMYFAEMIYCAVFDYPAHSNFPIAGLRISNLAQPTRSIQNWSIDARKQGWLLSNGECDYIMDWCNPVHVVFGGQIALWGTLAYCEGVAYKNAVMSDFIKNAIGFVDGMNEIIYDEPFLVTQLEDEFIEKLVACMHEFTGAGANIPPNLGTKEDIKKRMIDISLFECRNVTN